MKDEEFNLSKKEIDLKGVQDVVYQGVYFRNEIKEFIKRLKEEIDNTWKDITDTYVDSGTISKMHKLWLIEKIDKLAGDKLTSPSAPKEKQE